MQTSTEYPLARIEDIEIVFCHDDHAMTEFCGEFKNNLSMDEYRKLERSDGSVIDRKKNGDMERNEYRYFITETDVKSERESLNKLGYSKGNSEFMARCYAKQQYKMIKSLYRDDWIFMGIKVIAKLSIPNPIMKDNSCRLDHAESSGLWGIEYGYIPQTLIHEKGKNPYPTQNYIQVDEETDYIKEVIQDQIEELRSHLTAMYRV